MTTALDAPAWYTLPTLLDSRVVESLRHHLREDATTSRLVIDAGRLRRMDPVGAIRLWQVLVEYSHRSGATVELLHLTPDLALRLRRHPLLAFVGSDDALFADPLEGPRDSER